jgi:pilus assembly protein Flp/PilA
MRKYLNAFLKDESGATMVEYGLMVAVIAMIVVVGGIGLGISMNDTMVDTTRCSDAPTAANCVLD